MNTEEIEALLTKLDECDLGDWDRDFVDDMTKRFLRHDVMDGPFHVTGRQVEQLHRMKEQYL